MIRFIDTKTGNVYDGSAPYIHWFDEKQSVGLNYDKQFIVLTDESSIVVRLDSKVFFLIDPEKIGYYHDEQERGIIQTFNDKEYIDLEALKTKELYPQLARCSCEDCEECESYNTCPIAKGYNIFSFNIVAQGNYVGEVHETFTINDEVFTIGADFVDENEALGINLGNFGAEISNEIQRAIYEKPIDEQKPDYILLNRKFKELLNEYINILGNKGSYKSLINSLNWFEYGDLVKIYEYWKHGEPNQNYLSKHDITQFVNQTTEWMLYSCAKTTYVGISAALEKIKQENGEIVYENNYNETPDTLQLVDEPNPALEEVSMLWNKEEMSLKMVLLGNFFATYFLPIHLDLIHSTIENIVYACTLKMVSFPELERMDICDNIEDFQCAIEKVYHLTNLETFTNLDTAFGYIHDAGLDLEDEALEILGVDTQFTTTRLSDDRIKAYATQYFKGIGVLIPLHCILHHVTENATITEGTLKLYKDGKCIIERDTTNINHFPEEGNVHIFFNLLIREIGTYKVQLDFRRSDGIHYIKVLDFEVDGENYPSLTMYKLVPKYNENTKILFNLKDWMQNTSEDTPYPFGKIADYVLNPVQYQLKSPSTGKTTYEEPVIYSQFICSSTASLNDSVMTNQVFILRIPSEGFEEGKIYFIDRNIEDSQIDFYNVINSIDTNTGRSSLMSDVVWMKMNREGEFIDPTNDQYISEWITFNDYVYYIGINTCFNKLSDTEKPYFEQAHYHCKKTDSSLKVWIRDMFIPYFYTLEEIGEVSLFNQIANEYTPEDLFKIRNAQNTYTIKKSDVVCFLPSLRCLRRPDDFMWKFICQTNNREIVPITFRRGNMTILYNSIKYTNALNKQETQEIQAKVSPNDNVNDEKTPFPTILQPLFGRYDFRVVPSVGYYDVVFNYKLDDQEKENHTITIASQFLIEKQGKQRIYVDPSDDPTPAPQPVYDELYWLLIRILKKMNIRGFNPHFLDDYR